MPKMRYEVWIQSEPLSDWTLTMSSDGAFNPEDVVAIYSKTYDIQIWKNSDDRDTLLWSK